MPGESHPPVKDGFVFGWHLLSKPDATSVPRPYDDDEVIGTYEAFGSTSRIGATVMRASHEADIQQTIRNMHIATNLQRFMGGQIPGKLG